MLTNSDYLDIVTREPIVEEETLSYNNRPVTYYDISHDGERYLVMLVDEDDTKKTETFCLIQYSDSTESLLLENRPQEFICHSDNSVHQVIIEYTDMGLRFLSGKKYEGNQYIPDNYLHIGISALGKKH